jgi:hypothetical protein
MPRTFDGANSRNAKTLTTASLVCLGDGVEVSPAGCDRILDHNINPHRCRVPKMLTSLPLYVRITA